MIKAVKTVKPEPLFLQFESDTKCNGACTFCMHPKMKRSGRASWSQLLNVMYWHVPYAKSINPFGMQEPTLEPRLGAILSNCKMFNRHAETSVYTNMSHYDERVWTEIIRNNLLDKLTISFYGVTKKVYSQLQPNLSFQQVQNNIKQLMRLRTRLRWRKPQVHMNLIITPETHPHINRFLHRWRNIVDVVGFTHYDAWCGGNSYDESFQRRVWGEPATTRAPCQRLWSTLVIHYNGDVVPCCLDYNGTHVLGNIHEDHKTFTGDKFNSLRQQHVEGKQDEINLCRDCTLWRYETPKEWQTLWRVKPVISVANR